MPRLPVSCFITRNGFPALTPLFRIKFKLDRMEISSVLIRPLADHVQADVGHMVAQVLQADVVLAGVEAGRVKADWVDAYDVEIAGLLHVDLGVLVGRVDVVVGEEGLDGAVELPVLDARELGGVVGAAAELH